MSDHSNAEFAGGKEWPVEPDLDPRIRVAFARQAELELARRSRSGSLVYFAVVVLLAASTPYYAEHPAILCSAGAVMLLLGIVRDLAARRLPRNLPVPGAGAVRLLRATIYATMLAWGVFCAVTLGLYPGQWTSLFLLLATAALASGATSSLASDAGLATRSLVLLLAPAMAVSAFLGDRIHVALAGAGVIYLVFLIAQARGNATAYWKIFVAAERERLRNSEERQRIEAERATMALAVEQAAEEIVITDAGGTIQYCNPAFERGTGYSRAEVMGHKPSILQSGKMSTAFYRDLWDTLHEGRVWSGRFTNRRKDGTLYEAEGTISPLFDAAGAVSGYVSVLDDVTGRLELEEQLRQAQKLESIGRLAGGVAHDFNNLLTVILGYSRVLLDEHPDPDDPDHAPVTEISSAAERAASLTGQLLSFSRKQVLRPRAIALDGLVAEMHPMLQRLVGEDIRVEAPGAGEGFMVRADPGQMSQILMNLAANARDAMPHGGAITIGLAPAAPGEVPAAASPRLIEGPCVRLSVRDTGLGMDEDTRQRLFEPFFTTKELGRGIGLGLATVYGIVQQSGGFIAVRSEPGTGTEFLIYLPRVADEPEPAGAAPPAPPSRGGAETILVVEDQDELRRMVSAALRTHGYRVLDASGGAAALAAAAAEQGTIDLLLTDVVMPDLTGKQVADQVRQIRPNIRVIFMSGYSADVIAGKGVLDRGVSYLAKPFTLDALAAKVRDVLDAAR